MNPFTTPGAISWSELQTSDHTAAVSFYSAVFGWDVQTRELDLGPYSVVSSGSSPAGGIMTDPSGGRVPPHWVFYVTVPDVDAAAEKVKRLGGAVLMEPLEAPGIGKMCVVQDPQGAVFELVSYVESFLTDELRSVEFVRSFATHGLFSWFELRTKDVAAASEFYSSLFGWEITVEQMAMGPYSIIKVGEVGIGGILAPPGLEMPNHWGGYVTIDDADLVAEKVRSEGGTVVAGPMDLPSVGRMVIFLDPQGASLACLAYLPMEGVTT